MKIEDDFLKQKDFDKIQQFIMQSSTNTMGPHFPWFYNDTIDSHDDVDKFQFIHSFYKRATSRSSFMDEFSPILELIQPLSILQIKANLLTRTPNIVENSFHVDMQGLSEERLKQATTAILYINTNNGYTKFEDGTIVKSVANRWVTFPGNMKHTGTSCTDEKTRVVINFNYFETT